MFHVGDKIFCVCFPALKGWANIGRRFATTSLSRLTLFAMERSAPTNVFGIGWFDENRVDLDVVPTSNPSNLSGPSVRDALHRPAVAKRQPMVAQPFKAGRGGGVRIRLIETLCGPRIRPVPSARGALHHPVVALRQPMVAQPFKAGRGGREGLTSGSGPSANNLPNVVNQVRNAVVIGGLVGDR
jgi:hypothetical protein